MAHKYENKLNIHNALQKPYGVARFNARIFMKPGFHVSVKSQTIGDIYDFELSLVGKIWASRETVKSSIARDFPDK